MAMIKCTECGKDFSDKAAACPNCGCPIEKMGGNIESVEVDEAEKEKMQDKISESKDFEKKEKNPFSKKPVLIACVAVVVIVIGAGIAYLATGNSRKYTQASEYFENKEYEKASDLYKELGDYKDAENKAGECDCKITYMSANKLYDQENYKDALVEYTKLGTYEDSQEKVKDCEYQLSVDGSYLRDMAKGLMARWDQNEIDNALGENPDAYRRFCDKELEKVESYADKEFDDKQLGEDAKQYIKALQNAKEATTFYTVDYNTYNQQWAAAYATRTMLLNKFFDEYGLKVDDKYQDTVNQLQTDGLAAEKQKTAKETIQKIADSFSLEGTTDEWGYTTYKLHMKNDTEYTFDYFYVEISVLDNSGKIVNTGSSSQVSSWVPEQEAEVDAYIGTNEAIPEGCTTQYTLHYQTGTFYQ